MEELIARFTAYDGEGQEYTVEVYEKYVDVGTRANPNQRVPGVIRLQTDTGESVNRHSKGRYETVHTKVVLTSDDPLAI